MKTVKFSMLVIALLFFGNVINVQSKCNDFDCEDEDTVELSMMSSQIEERYPQTVIHDIVSAFLMDEDNSKAKKVLVLGYDGYREDALANIMNSERSAINIIASDGGLYRSYAGADGNQETSTAPGWLSILSGTWAYQLGVSNNNDTKQAGVATFLDEAINQGYASTFIASWAPHFDITYQEDIAFSQGKAVYQQMEDDDETIATLHDVLADTAKSSYDVVFATLEYADHAGHTAGYGNDIEEYVQASQDADQAGYELLQTIYERASYEEEDWLLIITTDHGGLGGAHGGQSIEERNTWFAVNQSLSK